MALLLAVVAGAQLVNLGLANPFEYHGAVPPDSSAKPPRIWIFSPQNNTVHGTNVVRFSINVSLPESLKAVETGTDKIYYEADWQQNRTYLYNSWTAGFDDQISSSRSAPKNRFFEYSQDFTSIPEGKHTIKVYALGSGSYVEGVKSYSFNINSTISLCFTIDIKASPIPLLITASGASAAAIGLGLLLVYFKKFKH